MNAKPGETKPVGWTFSASCDTCGVVIPTPIIDDGYRQNGEHLEYVVTLDRLDVEAHLLTHGGPE